MLAYFWSGNPVLVILVNIVLAIIIIEPLSKANKKASVDNYVKSIFLNPWEHPLCAN